jgi:hypothetical protein
MHRELHDSYNVANFGSLFQQAAPFCEAPQPAWAMMFVACTLCMSHFGVGIHLDQAKYGSRCEPIYT